MEYRRLGKSNLLVSAVGFGTCQLRLLPDKVAIDTLLKSFELGVNIVHTGPDYGKAEDLVAKAIVRTDRKVIVASHGADVPTDGSGPVRRFEALFEATCARLGSERLDLYGIACIDDREAFKENVWGKNGMVEFLQRKKEEGRIGGIFCSTHGAPEYVSQLVTCGVFDAVMIAYNVLGYHLLSCHPSPGRHFECVDRNKREIFPLCQKHDVGLMIIKPLGGGLLCESRAFPPRHEDMSVLKHMRAADCLRSILLNPEVSCVLPGTTSVAEAEENARSGYGPVAFGAEEQQGLEEVVKRLRRTVCSRCGACEPLCSQGLPISWLFRAALINLYPSALFEVLEHMDYFRLHPQLEAKCASCPSRTCVCPNGIDIPKSLMEMHRHMLDLLNRRLIPGPTPGEGRAHGGRSFDAIVVSLDIPEEVMPEKTYLCRLCLENTGSHEWLQESEPNGLRVALGVLVGEETISTVHLTQNVPSGCRCHVLCEIIAPPNRGHCLLRLRLFEGNGNVSENLGIDLFTGDISVREPPGRLSHIPLSSDVKVEHMRREEKAYIRTQPTPGEVEAERNTLRATVEAQRQQLLVATDRLRTLEQLFRTIQAGRAYKLLRRLGRWKWVEQTLAELPRDGEPTAQPPALNDVDERTASDALGPSPSTEPLRDWNLNPILHPLEAAYGYGGHLVDPQGHDFIDFSSAWGANILGYGYPRVAEAIAAQARRFAGVGMPYPEFRELERLLCEVIPGAELVRYGKNGSDATMGAVRLARAITRREHVLHRGYHGFHDWWMASTDCQGIPQALKELIEPLWEFTPEGVDKVFQEHPGQIACIIFDPMVPPMPEPAAVREIMEITHRHGALMIFDEVVTGFRLAPGGMQEIWRLQPDLACHGKSVANGLPLSVLSGKQVHMRHLPAINYGMTFEGEAISIAAALATVREILERNVCQALAEKGRFLTHEYGRLATQYGIATRLGGPAARPHLVCETQDNVPERELRWLCIQELARAGVLTIGTFNLCYSHDDKDLHAAAAAFEGAMKVLRRALDNQSVAHLLDARVHQSMH